MATQLNIYRINKVQPYQYTDRLLTDEKPVLDGVFEIVLQTEDPVDFKDDPTWQVRDVQKVFFPKYKLTLYDSTDYYVELLKYSSKVIVVQDGLANQEAVITDVSRDRTGQSLYTITIEYYDRSVNNYTGTVVEFLKSEWLKDDAINPTSVSVDTYDLYYSPTGYISTRIVPDTLFPEFEQSTVSINDIVTTTKSVQPTVAKCIFFCSRSEALGLQENAYKNLLTLTGYGQAKEIVQPVISKLSGWDIYKVEIDFVYNKLKYYQ